MTEVEFRRSEAGRETEPTAQIRPTIEVRVGRRLATETRKRAKEPPPGASLHHAATEKRKQRNRDHDETPRAARPPPRLVRRSASGIGGLVDRAALKSAPAIRSSGKTQKLRIRIFTDRPGPWAGGDRQRAPKQHTPTPIDGAFGYPSLLRRKYKKARKLCQKSPFFLCS